jgi:hypothetical protein
MADVDLDLSKTFIGVVEDNADPERKGRCKVRVLDVFDGLPTSDIPWATPQKDLNGNTFYLPEVGKVVSVVFDNENLYTPEYRYAQHYNVNLVKKLKDLGDDAYKSMRVAMFDHKAQIFANDDDGMMIDYKFNQIHIDDGTINLNLKGNGGAVNIGTETADQQAILGNNFMDWFDTLVDELLGQSGGPYLGNCGAPVIPNPNLIQILLRYKALKDPKFLSKNVYFNDNLQVDDVERPSDGQLGDGWSSTVKENELTTKEPADFRDRGKGAPDGTLTPSTNPDSPVPITSAEDIESQDPPEGEVSPDIDALLEVLRFKKYKIFERPYEVNTIGVRYQYPGQDYSNQFKDRMYALWKDKNGQWKQKNWAISTIPGKIPGSKDRKAGIKYLKDKVGKSRGGLGILKPAQYIDVYYMDYHLGKKNYDRAMRTKGKQLAYRDQNYGSPKLTYTNEDPKNKKGGSNFAMFIHKAYNSSKNTYGVQNWSEGCQVFQDPKCLNQYFDICQIHKDKYGNSFSYALITSKDVEDAEKRLAQQG